MESLCGADADNEHYIVRRSGIWRAFFTEAPQYRCHHRYYIWDGRVCPTSALAQLSVSAIWYGNQWILDADVYEYH